MATPYTEIASPQVRWITTFDGDRKYDALTAFLTVACGLRSKLQ